MHDRPSACTGVARARHLRGSPPNLSIAAALRGESRTACPKPSKREEMRGPSRECMLRCGRPNLGSVQNSLPGCTIPLRRPRRLRAGTGRQCRQWPFLEHHLPSVVLMLSRLSAQLVQKLQRFTSQPNAVLPMPLLHLVGVVDARIATECPKPCKL